MEKQILQVFSYTHFRKQTFTLINTYIVESFQMLLDYTNIVSESNPRNAR